MKGNNKTIKGEKVRAFKESRFSGVTLDRDKMIVFKILLIRFKNMRKPASTFGSGKEKCGNNQFPGTEY